MSANKATPPIPTVRDSPVGPEVMKQVDHVFVLMLENRSFDSLFGFLYEPTGTTAPSLESPPPFHGLLFPSPKAPTCEPPAQAPEGAGPRYSRLYGNKLKSDPSDKPTMAWIPRDPSSQFEEGKSAFLSDEDARTFLDQAHWPPVNPGEHHDHVARQLYGVDSPNEAKWDQVPPMSGFIDDYAHVWREEHKVNDGSLPNRAKDIMQSVHPSLLPVMTRLAHEYAVSDYWFASVPTQTWPNRLFSLAATSHGLVYNDDNSKLKQRIEHITKYPVRSVFSHMDEFHGGPASQAYDKAEDPKRLKIWDARAAAKQSWSWSVYSHTLGYDMVSSLLGALFADEHVIANQYRNIEQLSADARDNERPLPAFALIEPAFFPYNRDDGKVQLHNDLHPAETVEALTDYIERPPVWEADRLVLKVYEALFGEGVEQSRKNKTLFIVLFDEHGGCYDHIPPPATVHPHHAMPDKLPSEFAFQRLGVRLPALFISPLIQKGTVLRPKEKDKGFDHTSVIRSLRERWTVQIDPSSSSAVETPALTRRDASAPSFWHVLTAENHDESSGRKPQSIINDLKNSLKVLDGRHEAAQTQLKLKRNKEANIFGRLWNYFSDLGKGIIISGMASAGPLKKAGLPFPTSGSRSVDLDKADLLAEAQRHFEQGACPLKKAGFPFPASESRFIELNSAALTAEARRHFEQDIAQWKFGAVKVAASPAPSPPTSDPAGNQPPVSGGRTALLVGINNYPGNEALHGCREDALAMDKLLKRYGFETKVLQTDEECSKESILKNLWERGSKMKEDDVFVFYFSGHGSTAASQDAPSGTGYSESLVAIFSNFNERERSFITDSEIDLWLSSVSAGLPILIFDCCHAGGVSRDIGSISTVSDRSASIPNGPSPSNQPDATGISPKREAVDVKSPEPLPTFTRSRSVERVDVRSHTSLLSKHAIQFANSSKHLERRPHVVLAAATDGQTATEQQIDGKYRGVFTEALEHYLHQLVGKECSYADLLPMVQQRLKHERKCTQTPVFEARAGLNRQIFGLKMLPVTRTVRLLPDDTDKHRAFVAAGSVHGINPTSVWIVEPNALNSSIDNIDPGEPGDLSGSTTVSQVGDFLSSLESPQSCVRITGTSRAKCTKDMFKHVVQVTSNSAAQQLEHILRKVNHISCTARNQDQKEALRLTFDVLDGRISAKSTYNSFRGADYPDQVLMLSLPIHDRLFVGNLDTFTWYHGALASVADIPGPEGLSFKEVTAKFAQLIPIDIPLASSDSATYVFDEGTTCPLSLHNGLDYAVQLSVLAFESDASIYQILPTPGAELTTRLAAKASLNVTFSIAIPLAADRMKNGDTQLVFRFILSRVACDSSFLMQPGMQSHRAESFISPRMDQFSEKAVEEREEIKLPSSLTSDSTAVSTIKIRVRPRPLHRELTCRYSLAHDDRWRETYSPSRFQDLVRSLGSDDFKSPRSADSHFQVVPSHGEGILHCTHPGSVMLDASSTSTKARLRISIILVHGCTADSSVTWCDGKFDAQGKPSSLLGIRWNEFLASVISSSSLKPKQSEEFSVRVLPFSHPGAAGFAVGGSSAATAQEIAEALLAQIGKEPDQEQLVFCSHGTGALLVSHLLHDTERLRQITRGVICLGVPDWENIKSNLHVLNTVLGWRSTVAKPDHDTPNGVEDFVEKFKSEAKIQWGKGFPDKIRTAFFYADCLGSDRDDVFVPPLPKPADNGTDPNRLHISIPTLDHLSLPKIGSADDPLAKRIIETLKSWFEL